jgi:hypothetical protein
MVTTLKSLLGPLLGIWTRGVALNAIKSYELGALV